MKIAIINSAFAVRGGTARVIAHQAKGLVERGHEVTILAPVIREGTFADVLPREVSVRRLHGIPSPPPLARLISFWLHSLPDVDVIVAHNQPGPYVAMKAKAELGIPYVLYMHNPWRRLYPRPIDICSPWFYGSKGALFSLIAPLMRRIDKASVRNADAFLSNSKLTSEEAEKIYGVKPEVCYPGVDLSLYSRVSPSIAREYGADEYSVVSVGRHVPQKKFDWLLQVFKEVRKRVPEAKLFLIGKTSQHTKDLLRLARDLGVRDRLRILGEVSEETLISFYKACPVLCSTAIQEEFSMTIVEAMAAGCVPVAWDEGGPRETIVDGRTGFLVRPYDREEMASVIIEILSDKSLREELAKEATCRALEFDWSNHICLLERTLLSVKNLCNFTDEQLFAGRK